MIGASINLKHDEVVILALLLLSTFFSIHDIYKLFFNAALRSKINLIINNCALLLLLIMNLTSVHLKLSLVCCCLCRGPQFCAIHYAPMPV